MAKQFFIFREIIMKKKSTTHWTEMKTSAGVMEAGGGWSSHFQLTFVRWMTETGETSKKGSAMMFGEMAIRRKRKMSGSRGDITVLFKFNVFKTAKIIPSRRFVDLFLSQNCIFETVLCSSPSTLPPFFHLTGRRGRPGSLFDLWHCFR